MMENYQAKFVAFIDILGFKDLVLQSENDDGKFIQIMNSIYQYDAKYGSHGLIHIDMTNFSDSFVFSCHKDFIYFDVLISLINKLYITMLEFGTLSRGGISFGSMFHDEEMAFGPAFLEAYQLESTVACYPRIVLGKRAFDEVQSLAIKDKINGPKFIQKWFRRDEDGVVYVNQFAGFDVALSNEDPDDKLAYSTRANIIREHLSEKISTITESPDIFKKYLWIVNEFNTMVSHNKVHDSSLEHINTYNIDKNYIPVRGPYEW